MITWGFSQNLMVNGDLESWSGGTPDGWEVIENITQETTTVHGGASAAKHTSASSTKDFRQTVSGVQGGQEYTISYWYFDNDNQARTRIWAYWLEGSSTLPDHADILRPGEYSEDNANWLQFNEVLVAPATADGFRFEVRVYNQDGNSGGAVFYDDFVFSGEVIINPEPTNYPTDFTATAAGSGIDLSWTDATGADLPSAYVIFAGIDSSLPLPVDGTPVLDDTDLSDGSGAINISYGIESYTFTGLDANTTYYFTIYPYANSGVNIDYKNDGTAPTANATTQNITTIFSQSFDDGWGEWTTISVTGDQEWEIANYGNPPPCASMSGYDGQAYDNEDWLISPAFNLDDYANEVLVFQSAMNYTGPDLELKISTDYSGSGDPNNATWTDLSFSMPPGGNWDFYPSGNIDLSIYSGSNAYIGYKFTSTTAGSATWEVDEIILTGEEDYVIDPEPTNYPTDFMSVASGLGVDITWTDAIGDQLPDAYILYAGLNSSLPVPVDGTPVPNDTDLSDGSATVNIAFGQESYEFMNLSPNTTYYFSIYPYTNSGVDIDYKNDGTAPADNATTENITYVTIEEQNFDNSWDDWTTISVVGDQAWEISEIYGDPPPCATISGYDGQSYDNEDWLISPALPLDDFENEVLTFEVAMNYTGPDLELLVSNDYTGAGDPNAANWTMLTYDLPPGGSWDWFESGDVLLNDITGSDVYVAFKFTSTTAGSATWELDNILIVGEGEFNPDPEPTNYPTDFSASAGSTAVNLSWTDASGDQLPTAYVIFGSSSSTLPVPVDGTPIADDTDLSDGEGVLNIMYGQQSASFGGLEPNETYYFSIYPYTNYGTAIDYKNDGTAPAAQATTQDLPIETILEQDFTDFGNWITFSVTGDQVWEIADFGNPPPCAKMSGYDGGSFENEDWLISPAMNLDGYVDEILTFESAMNYTGPDLQLKVSNDYAGSGDPNLATWTDLTFDLPPGGDWDFYASGDVSLAAITGTAVHIGFKYTSTASNSATWELDNVLIEGAVLSVEEHSFAQEINIYPNPSQGYLNVVNYNQFPVEISIFNSAGQMVMDAYMTQDSQQFNLDGLESGLYLIRFVNPENLNSATQKLIIR